MSFSASTSGSLPPTAIWRARRAATKGTAEGEPFSFDELDELLTLAKHSIREIIDVQKQALA
ncbi:ribonuclease PH [Pseudoalteromonas agarivorans DSM 14585]|uniref:Ribonuclease PH n=1 Tax=Pseudoalteromonas agarivorans DSM 14585 TaxID=1312369 RepID=A0ACA8E0U3_9GAMM|nr:ribonuclease PH [Pseudoalteromonas agarivorans DSM 14585]